MNDCFLIFLIIILNRHKHMSSVPGASTAAAAVQEHPDASYIKRDDLGLVIAKGLAVMYKTQPSNPVDFLAKWLLNYSSVQQTAVAAQQDQKMQAKELKDKHAYHLDR
jgi:hypothetical protein